ncbi:MAG TPA: Ig-like domain-containing protein [Candidatus Saccharimonadales bacterium]|nr:Ig-like domain-containing protein [Candidatus Saccharimonadales bacterium]
MKTSKRDVLNYLTRHNVIAILAVLLFSAIGTSLLLQSHASPAPSPNGYYQNIPAGTALAALKSGSTCAQEVIGRNSPWEPKPENKTANQTVPTAAQLASFHTAENNAYFTRVDGLFSGTTDQIIQWASCKWGFEDNIFRAEGVIESNWLQSAHGDVTTIASHCPADADKTTTGCYQSYGFLQNKWIYNQAAYPMYRYMTAFEIDYALAQDRQCYDQHGGDYKGCLAEWFTGNFAANGTGSSYVGDWQTAYTAKPWLTWADLSTPTNTTPSDTQSPTVSLPEPDPSIGNTVSGQTTITATAGDNVGVTKVELYANDQLVDTVTASPYVFNWDTTQYPNNDYSLVAKAYDAAGNPPGVSNEVVYTVANNDTTQPTAPKGVTAVAQPDGSIQVDWQAAVDNSDVVSYNIWRNSADDPDDEIASVDAVDAASGYNDTFVTPGVTYEYQIEAVDSVGNVSTKSAVVTVTAPSDTSTDVTPPDVSLTQPSDGDTVSGIVNISATASDDVAVTKVEFYVDGVLIDTSNGLPGTSYSASFDSKQYTNEAHDITAIAYDAADNVSQSDIFVNVDNSVNNVQLTPPSSVEAQANASDTAILVTWNPSTVPGTGYYIERIADGSIPETIDQVPASSHSFNDTTVVADGTTYSYQIVAFDDTGNTSEPSAESNGVTLQPPVVSTGGVLINAGGGTYNEVGTGGTGSSGTRLWSGDKYFTGGTVDDLGAGVDISGTDIGPIYQDERTGPMSYSVPVADGKYAVRLHFAEISPDCQQSGCRVFSVSVNGDTFLNDFDIYDLVGGYAADVEQTIVDVTNGKVDIDFTPITGDPQIAGIEIVPADSSAPTMPTNLAAKAVSASQINLSWDVDPINAGVVAYRIFRNGSTDYEEVPSVPDANGQMTWGDTGLTPNTTYTYVVQAVDGSGNVSPVSDSASATTLKTSTRVGNITGTVTVTNPINPYKCPTDPQLTVSATVPAKGSTRYICTQKAQFFLNFYINAGLKVNGVYNSAVCPAVNRYKKRVGLKPDCIFGKGSWAYLETYGKQIAPGFGAKITYFTGTTKHVVTANKNGNYTIMGLPSGARNFTYALPNYTSQTISVTIPINQTITKNVNLRHP